MLVVGVAGMDGRSLRPAFGVFPRGQVCPVQRALSIENEYSGTEIFIKNFATDAAALLLAFGNNGRLYIPVVKSVMLGKWKKDQIANYRVGI